MDLIKYVFFYFSAGISGLIYGCRESVFESQQNHQLFFFLQDRNRPTLTRVLTCSIQQKICQLKYGQRQICSSLSLFCIISLRLKTIRYDITSARRAQRQAIVVHPHICAKQALALERNEVYKSQAVSATVA